MNTREEIKRHQVLCAYRRPTLPKGAWTTEPDRVQFEAHGFDCLIVRHVANFHWCGYVGLPPGHPLHGADTHDERDLFRDLSVHGGITYGQECDGAVCHIADEGDHLWWLGFDCAHGGDLSPGLLETMRSAEVALETTGFQTGTIRDVLKYRYEKWHYWTAEEVMEETKRLAEQLRAAA